MQREHNPKRHIPPVSLFLCHKMVAVLYFVWSLALLLWSVSTRVTEADEISNFCDFKKNDIQPPEKCFAVVNAIFDVRWTNWFSLHKTSLGWFLEAAFLAAGDTITLILLKKYYQIQ